MTRIDAIVPASALTLELARELEQLAPFGLGNPDVTLLVADCEAVGASTVGDGKHLRFRVRQHGRDAGSAIAFGLGGQLDRAPGRGTLRRRVQAEAEPLERHRRAAARRPSGLRHGGCLRGAAHVARRAVAGRRGRVDARGAAHLRRARARATARGKRQLLESPTFRVLLEHGVPLDAAAGRVGREARQRCERAGRAGRRPGERPLELGEQPEHATTLEISAERAHGASCPSAEQARDPVPRTGTGRRDRSLRRGTSTLGPWPSSMRNVIRTTSSAS